MNRYCGHQRRDGKKLGHYGIVKQLDQPTTEPVQQLAATVSSMTEGEMLTSCSQDFPEQIFFSKLVDTGDFPGGPAVKTLS